MGQMLAVEVVEESDPLVIKIKKTRNRKKDTQHLPAWFAPGEWLTSKEAAEYLGMSKQTFLNRVKSFPALLPYEKPTNVFRFKRTDIEAFSQLAKTRPPEVV